MMKQTILHTIETGGPGGAESVLLALATRIDTSRFRSVVLLPHEGWLQRKLLEKGIPVFLAKSSAWYDLHLLKAMARLVRQEKVHLIHSHLSDQNFYSSLVGRLTGCKTIVTYHGALPLPGATHLRDRFKLWVARNWATATVVVSDYLKQSLVALRFSPQKIVQIYNGIDVDRFAACRLGRLRRELQCSDDTKLVGMVANLRQSKAHEFFIRAARQVCDSFPQARFVAVGAGDDKVAGRLSGLVAQLGLQDRFFFLGFREDIPDILSDLDVFVLSSTSEGFSLATVEAMAAGKPVVVTRSGGPLEIVDDGFTGLLVLPADVGGLAARICQLLKDPERASALGHSARAKVGNMFNLSRMIDEYERLYERCLGRNEGESKNLR